jgi:hypothetical protein
MKFNLTVTSIAVRNHLRTDSSLKFLRENAFILNLVHNLRFTAIVVLSK